MAKHGSDSPCASSAKKKYAAKYKPEWATDLQFVIICHSDKGPTFAYCRVCNTHINVVHGGKSDIVRHASSASHSTLQKATSSPTATPTASVCSWCVERSQLGTLYALCEIDIGVILLCQMSRADKLCVNIYIYICAFVSYMNC